MRFSTRIGLAFAAGSVIGLASALGVHAAALDNVHPDVWRQLDKQGDPAKVWVMFADKDVATARTWRAAADKLQVTYHPRALERRRRRRTAPGLFDARDFPVCQDYVDAVRACGTRIDVTSRWLNAVSATATSTQLEAISNLCFVKSIQLVGRGKRVPPIEPDQKTPAVPEREGPPPPASPGNLNYGSSEAQLAQINVIALHDLGYTGAGVVLGILDTGFYKDHESIQAERIIAEWDFINHDANTQNETGDPSSQHDHGTKVLSIAAGRKDGSLYGPAYEADLILCKTEDISQEEPVEEDWYVAGLEFAESHGADVVTSSLGYIDWYTQAQLDGQTAVTTIAVNIATANGVVCCTAAGNEGMDGLLAPADAFEVIAVGAVDSTGSVASFSSRGPTADGRVKPEVVALGVGTWGATASGPASYNGIGNGTSFATPLVAGTVACLLQAHPNWTVDHVRTALFHTADYYVAHGTVDPDYARGYGLIDALAAHQMPFVPGDFDLDTDVDAADLAHLRACMTGPSLGPPDNDCRDADLDGDADVDQTDFGILQRCFSTPGIAGDPECAD